MNTDYKIINQLYKLLQTLLDIFNKNNIECFADGGTLLGAVRHQGIIPWDDDIDLSIIQDSYNTDFFNNHIKHILNEKELDICKVTFGYKIFFKNGKKIKIKNKWKHHCQIVKDKYDKISRKDLYKEASKTYDKTNYEYYEYTYPFIDIFTMEKTEGLIKYNTKNNPWILNYFLEYDLYPLKDYKFGPLTIKGAHKPHNFLTLNYGENYMVEAYTDYNHETEEKIERVYIDI
jgi:phosphorylcholine metabolism protein LicD